MNYLRALRRPAVSILCVGETTAMMGDEIYKLVFSWLAVTLIGNNAGYLSAVESGTVLILGLCGARLFNLLPPKKTLIAATALRVACVVLFFLATRKLGPTVFALGGLACFLAVASVFYEPALQRLLPSLVENDEERQSANALLETTRRLAGILGPGLVTLLATWLALLQNYLLAGAVYAFSGVCFIFLKNSYVHDEKETTQARGSASQRDLGVALFCSISVWGLWGLVIQLGLPLLVQQRFPGKIAIYGSLLSAYGIANVLANVVAGGFRLPKNLYPIAMGIFLLGFGFFVLALGKSYVVMLLGTVIAALGGPLNDLAFLDVMQRGTQGEGLAKIYRLRMAGANGLMLVLFLISPWVFHRIAVEHAVVGASVLMIALAVGAACYARHQTTRTPAASRRS